MLKTLVSDRPKEVKVVYSRLLSFQFGSYSHEAVNYGNDVTNKKNCFIHELRTVHVKLLTKLRNILLNTSKPYSKYTATANGPDTTAIVTILLSMNISKAAFPSRKVPCAAVHKHRKYHNTI